MQTDVTYMFKVLIFPYFDFYRNDVLSI